MRVTQIFPKLFELLPDADHLLSLQPEELAGSLLISLISLDRSDRIDPFAIISIEPLRRYVPPQPSGRERYLAEHNDQILFALMESWQWLEREGFVAPRPTNLSEGTSVSGGVTYYFVTRRGKTIETLEAFESYRKGNLLPKHQLHSTIAQKVWSLFLRGDYDTAVFQAFKQVEIAVREAAEYERKEAYGTRLMREAFGKNGPLKDTEQFGDEESDVRSDLFAGAIACYKNPGSHQNVLITAEEAAEVIIFASHPLRIVDSRREI